jgi:hypothetical protein
MSANTIQLIVWGSVFIVALMLSESLRGIVKWVFVKMVPGVLQHPWSLLKTMLHEIVLAHQTVIRNLQPRKKVFFELSRKRTTERIDRE